MTENILHEVDRFCDPGDIVCDIFSGTISMSMALKKHGYRVISNDINEFSYHFANSYLRNNSIPEFDLKQLGINESDYQNIAIQKLEQKKNIEGYLFLGNNPLLKKYYKIAIILIYLEEIKEQDIDKDFRNHYIYNTYTEEGINSNFKSLRGKEGNRRFFTPENGKKIDNILNKIREWKIKHSIDDIQYSLLISITCESVEKISNTQGTFHDFQREKYDERALNPFTLRLPPFDDVIGTSNQHIIGHAQDSLEFIKKIPSHKLIYLDPPYNFRQYTSYYFMLNLISTYCTIQNLDEYFGKIQFVRGQNMETDFNSTFCKSNLFIPSLRQLIEDAKAQYIILSYYDGRNHENKGNKRNDRGIAEIENLFYSDLFVPNSFELLAFERTNYQSFQGHNASKCKEFLFIAEKRNGMDR